MFDALFKHDGHLQNTGGSAEAIQVVYDKSSLMRALPFFGEICRPTGVLVLAGPEIR